MKQMIDKIMKALGYMPIRDVGRFDDKLTIQLVEDPDPRHVESPVVDYFYQKEEDVFKVLFRGDVDYMDFPTEEVEEVLIISHKGEKVFSQKAVIEKNKKD